MAKSKVVNAATGVQFGCQPDQRENVESAKIQTLLAKRYGEIGLNTSVKFMSETKFKLLCFCRIFAK